MVTTLASPKRPVQRSPIAVCQADRARTSFAATRSQSNCGHNARGGSTQRKETEHKSRLIWQPVGAGRGIEADRRWPARVRLTRTMGARSTEEEHRVRSEPFRRWSGTNADTTPEHASNSPRTPRGATAAPLLNSSDARDATIDSTRPTRAPTSHRTKPEARVQHTITREPPLDTAPQPTDLRSCALPSRESNYSRGARSCPGKASQRARAPLERSRSRRGAIKWCGLGVGVGVDRLSSSEDGTSQNGSTRRATGIAARTSLGRRARLGRSCVDGAGG